jgi:putative lipoprotein
MFAPRLLLPMSLLAAVLAGCQSTPSDDVASSKALQGVRMQGDLRLANDQLLFRPCQEHRFFQISDVNNTSIINDAHELTADSGANSLFADLRGKMKSGGSAGSDGVFAVSEVYRMQYTGPGCSDPNFKRITLRATGHTPEWGVMVSGQGMVVASNDRSQQALPYLQEQLPDGSRSLSTEANGERVELWVRPQRCVDSDTGTLQSLQAELRINGKSMSGCAHYGGATDAY